MDVKKKKRLRGSLTVEAAMVVPIFLFALISLIYLNEAIRTSDIVAQRLHQNARKMAVYAYAADKAVPGIEMGSLGGIAVSYAYVDGDVSKCLHKEGALSPGITWLRSEVMKNDIIDLVAQEQMKLPYDFMGALGLSITDRARVHAFTGFDPMHGMTEEAGGDEEIVYITPSGSVYHRSRNCSHLKVTPKPVGSDSLGALRNSSGGKYYECEYCASKKAQGVYYVTAYGDRYHTSLDCQGLKRDVIAVPVSKAGGRGPCKTCGY